MSLYRKFSLNVYMLLLFANTLFLYLALRWFSSISSLKTRLLPGLSDFELRFVPGTWPRSWRMNRITSFLSLRDVCKMRLLAFTSARFRTSVFWAICPLMRAVRISETSVKFYHITRREYSSFSCLQEPQTGFYPGPDVSKPRPPDLFCSDALMSTGKQKMPGMLTERWKIGDHWPRNREA